MTGMLIRHPKQLQSEEPLLSERKLLLNMKLHIFLVFLSGTFLLPGCSGILEEKPKSFFEEGNSFQSADDANAAIAAVYGRLRDIYDLNMIYLSDVNGEELEINPVVAAARDIDLNRYTSATPTFDEFYTRSYLLIDRANRVITNVARIDMNTALKSQIIGEALFLRALIYFNLVRAFGDVPLVTEIVNSTTNVAKARDASDLVYQQIIQDLTEAENVLPVRYSQAGQIGRATSGAAKSILAKVYLTRKNWEAAASKAKEVIDSGQYSLFSEYKDVFPPENKNGIEHIFSVQYSCVLNTYGSPMAQQFAMFFTYPIQQVGGYLYITPNYIDSYIEGDKRSKVNVVNEKENPATGAIIKPGLDQGPVTDKYWDPKPCGLSQARNNFIVVRYADILLMYAEALNELGGPTPEAYKAVNLIRARARNGDSGPQDLQGLTQQQFRDAILRERSWELCFEGHRRWDLLRTGRYMDILQQFKIPVEEKNLLYPIPQNEIDVNPLLKQNTGY